MTKEEMASKLLECFPKSFINYQGEFIAHKKSNTYLIFDKCETMQDLAVAVFEWFSRAAHKTAPYYSDYHNAKFNRFMLDGINRLLGTSFTAEDMDPIYTHMGNGVNHTLTVEFVASGYDMEILRAHERADAQRIAQARARADG
jgi:hypothetical protein